ncbi:hypothetical protein TNCV_3431391 [Trichonephila clavipes]|nr:hypothetical protein TNCV_3431391 [Trichonephila clavipes]
MTAVASWSRYWTRSRRVMSSSLPLLKTRHVEGADIRSLTHRSLRVIQRPKGNRVQMAGDLTSPVDKDSSKPDRSVTGNNKCAAGSTFTTSPCVFQNHRKVPGSRTFGIVAPIMCAVNDTIPDASVLSGVMHDEIGLQRNEARSFSETNLDSV